MSTHTCPGGCRRMVPRHKFACLDCWRVLPARLRNAIRWTYQRDHQAHARAMVEAMEWYHDHSFRAEN